MFGSALDVLNHVHGESATYKPRSGDPRAITIIVDRDAPQPVPPTQVLRPNLTVYVHNNVTTGILSTELDTGGDKLSIAKTIGGTAEDMAIVKLKAMGHYSLADRLMPISGKWWDKPWMPLDVASWEGALGTALATEGLSERSKGGLRHVRGTVAAWLTEYAAYEQADYEDEKATAERPCW